MNWKEQLQKIDKLPQRQDSLSDQLQDLSVIANKFGMYDAADFIQWYRAKSLPVATPTTALVEVRTQYGVDYEPVQSAWVRNVSPNQSVPEL